MHPIRLQQRVQVSGVKSGIDINKSNAGTRIAIDMPKLLNNICMYASPPVGSRVLERHCYRTSCAYVGERGLDKSPNAGYCVSRPVVPMVDYGEI